jgi:CRP/FNR family transcriptional regulator, cyclic AMP receptor protein
MAARLPRPDQPLPLVAVRTGQEVVRQGEACLHASVIETGALLATAVSPEGRVLALDVLGAGDLVGEPDRVPSLVTVRALRPGRLRPLSSPVAESLVAERARRTAVLALDLAWSDVTDRVDRRLTDLAERFGRPVPGGILLALPLTQEDLAALAGTSRESVNRALRRLERAGRVAVLARSRYLVRSGLQVVAT